MSVADASRLLGVGPAEIAQLVADGVLTLAPGGVHAAGVAAVVATGTHRRLTAEWRR